MDRNELRAHNYHRWFDRYTAPGVRFVRRSTGRRRNAILFRSVCSCCRLSRLDSHSAGLASLGPTLRSSRSIGKDGAHKLHHALGHLNDDFLRLCRCTVRPNLTIATDAARRGNYRLPIDFLSLVAQSLSIRSIGMAMEELNLWTVFIHEKRRQIIEP